MGDVTMIRIVLLSALVATALSLEADSTTFDAEVLNSGKNSLVKFLAPW